MKKNFNNNFNSLLEPSKFKDNGDSTIIKGKYGFLKETYEINSKQLSQKFHKPKGKYSILTLRKILDCNSSEYKYYLGKLISTMSEYLGDVTPNSTVLVIGLGNRHISSDSLGIEVVRNIHITRNLVNNKPQVCAFAPSVLGLTGIESADTIEGIASKINPDIIIMIDSLCASDVSRLGISFQVNNIPITPGSGVHNTRKKITSNTKTISIGVPLVVYANTFIKSALQNSNIDIQNICDKELKIKFNSLINQEFNELVTLNEIEYAVKQIGFIIAQAINGALNV